MESALVLEWRPAPTGGAMLKPALKADLDGFLEKAKADGRVTSSEWLVSGKGDRLFLIIHGPSDAVGRLTEDSALIYIKTMIQVSHADFHWSVCASGSTVDTMLAVQEAAKAAG